MSFVIRPAKKSDVHSLPEVEKSSGEVFRAIGMGSVSDMPVTSDETLKAAQKRGHLWVAEFDGDIAGFALAEMRDGLAHLGEVSVAPQFARKGVGTQLINQVIEWAKSAKSPYLTLTTFRDVPWNAPYYTKLGFSECDAEGFGPDHRDAFEAGRKLFPDHPRIVMRKPVSDPT